jgi:hypothetical protein
MFNSDRSLIIFSFYNRRYNIVDYTYIILDVDLNQKCSKQISVKAFKNCTLLGIDENNIYLGQLEGNEITIHEINEFKENGKIKLQSENSSDTFFIPCQKYNIREITRIDGNYLISYNRSNDWEAYAYDGLILYNNNGKLLKHGSSPKGSKSYVLYNDKIIILKMSNEQFSLFILEKENKLIKEIKLAGLKKIL